jgi:hypothetical protein
MLLGAGFAAGVLGVVTMPEAARAAPTRFDDTVEVAPPAGAVAVRLAPSGNVPYSPVTGGALHLDNSASTGAGAVLCSNRGADALGRLLVVNQMNPANPQHAVRIQNTGTASTVSVYHDPAGGAGDPSAEAVDIVSTNALDTALGVRGRESGRGTVKVVHEKPAADDADASALSIALEGTGTACQGIYIGNDAGNPTTGDLLHIRNGGPDAERLRLTAAGRLEVARGVSVRGTILATPAAQTLTSFQHRPRLEPVAAGGAGELANVLGFHASPFAVVGDGWSVATYSPLRVEAPGGSGAIHHLTGLEIRDFAGRATVNSSVRSHGPAVPMRHSGGVNVGSQATPETALHVRGNPSVHGSLSLDAAAGDPPPPAPGESARLYVKNGNLVLQWNNGKRALFTTIPLQAAGPYPVTVPVTTSTTAP